MIGQRLEHYQITERIGEGGMGTVYKAEDLTLKRTVAIKAIKPTHQDPHVATKRFLREAQAISQIDHTNVITVLEVIQKGGINFLVMQFVKGDSLREILKRESVEPAEACRIAGEVAAGLEAAHEVGVIHRDIKPENVIIEPSGRAKVLDFGVARLIDRSTLTRKGRIVGTLPYMAPEQIKGGKVDSRTDTYSLGVVLFEMLTGSVPFESKEEAALFYQILNVDPPQLMALVPGLPDGLEDIIVKALAKDPDNRYQSAAQMRHDLDVVISRMRSDSLESRRLYAKAKKRHRLGAAIGAALFIIIALMFWRMMGPRLVGVKSPPRIMVTRSNNSLGDADLEYLSGGIMDCLIAALGRLDGYNVISRQTLVSAEDALKLRTAGLSTKGDLFGAAEQVGADFLVTGSYAESGGVVRINCELNSVREGVLLESWSHDMANLDAEFFPSMDQFAGRIAGRLGATWRMEPGPGGYEHIALTQSLEALKYYQKGVEASEAGNVPEALENMRTAIEHDPQFTAAYLVLGEMSLDSDEKRSSLDMAMKYRQRAPPALKKLVEGAFHIHNGHVDEAIAAYEAVLAENPEQVQARSALASLLIRTRRFDDAVAEFAVAKSINPFDYSYYPQWWVAYFEVGREDKARAILEDWRRRMNKEPGPLYQLITLNGVTGHWDKYMALCDTLAEISPAAVQHRGHGLMLLGRLNEAEEIFQQVVANPDRFYAGARGLTYLSEVSYEREDYREGLERVQRALETSRDFYNHWMAGRLAAGCGEYALADEYAGEISALFDQSEDDSTTVEAFAFRRFYYHLRGEMAMRRGEALEAVEMFDDALRFSMRVDSPFFRTYMGRACLEAGDFARAVEELEQVLEVNPNYPPALFYLGKARIALGDEAEAGEVWDRLLTIWEDADRDHPLKVELDNLLARMDRR